MVDFGLEQPMSARQSTRAGRREGIAGIREMKGDGSRREAGSREQSGIDDVEGDAWPCAMHRSCGRTGSAARYRGAEAGAARVPEATGRHTSTVKRALT
jgi:hypothetical protein